MFQQCGLMAKENKLNDKIDDNKNIDKLLIPTFQYSTIKEHTSPHNHSSNRVISFTNTE